MTCSGRSRLESIYVLQLGLSSLYCDFLYEERKSLVMFREKAKMMKLLTTTVQQFLADHGLTSPAPSPPSSASSGSQCMSVVKSLPPSQSSPTSPTPSPPRSHSSSSPPDKHHSLQKYTLRKNCLQMKKMADTPTFTHPGHQDISKPYPLYTC